jgi:hypothetical protein
MTKNQLIADLRLKNPTMKVGSDETGYQEIIEEEYETILNQWADGIIAKQAEQAKKAESVLAKNALLERLGITADEAKLLLS